MFYASEFGTNDADADELSPQDEEELGLNEYIPGKFDDDWNFKEEV